MASSYICTCQSGSSSHADPSWRPPLCAGCRATEELMAAGHPVVTGGQEWREVSSGHSRTVPVEVKVKEVTHGPNGTCPICNAYSSLVQGNLSMTMSEVGRAIKEIRSEVVDEGVVPGSGVNVEPPPLPVEEKKVNWREFL